MHDRVQCFHLRFAPERPHAGQHFVDHYTQRKDIGAMIDRLPGGLFRRHVGHRSHDTSRFGERRFLCLGLVLWNGCALHELRQSEVQNLYLRFGRYHHVGRFDVAVDDPCPMCRCQRIGDLLRVVDRLRQRQCLMGDELVERFAWDVFHDQVIDTVVVGNIMQRDNVRMVQCRSRTGFLEETALWLRIGDFMWGSAGSILRATVR
jgi:hypothetical protein